MFVAGTFAATFMTDLGGFAFGVCQAAVRCIFCARPALGRSRPTDNRFRPDCAGRLGWAPARKLAAVVTDVHEQNLLGPKRVVLGGAGALTGLAGQGLRPSLVQAFLAK